MATWRSIAETQLKLSAMPAFLSKESGIEYEVPNCDPRISKLGRMEDFTVSGKWELPFLQAEHFTFGKIDVKP